MFDNKYYSTALKTRMVSFDIMVTSDILCINYPYIKRPRSNFFTFFFSTNTTVCLSFRIWVWRSEVAQTRAAYSSNGKYSSTICFHFRVRFHT